MSDNPKTKTDRTKLERALRAMNKSRHACSQQIAGLREAVHAAQRAFHASVDQKNSDAFDGVEVDDERPVAGPAFRYQQGADASDVAYQVEGMGPGAQYERWPEGAGWFVYRHPDQEESSDGPFTEEEALDWLWRHPPYGWHQ